MEKFGYGSARDRKVLIPKPDKSLLLNYPRNQTNAVGLGSQKNNSRYFTDVSPEKTDSKYNQTSRTGSKLSGKREE
jgi:hypothetical protein